MGLLFPRTTATIDTTSKISTLSSPLNQSFHDVGINFECNDIFLDNQLLFNQDNLSSIDINYSYPYSQVNQDWVELYSEIEFDYAAYTSENLTRLNAAISDFQNI